MISSVYSIRHLEAGLVGTSLDVVLAALKRFPPGRYPVYRSGGGSWWTPSILEVCGIADRRATGSVDFTACDRAAKS